MPGLVFVAGPIKTGSSGVAPTWRYLAITELPECKLHPPKTPHHHSATQWESRLALPGMIAHPLRKIFLAQVAELKQAAGASSHLANSLSTRRRLFMILRAAPNCTSSSLGRITPRDSPTWVSLRADMERHFKI